MSGLVIRSARPEDAPALAAIYAPYVLHTAISFETKAPAAEDFINRLSAVQKTYPWLAAEQDGELLGYAYAGRLGERAAYDWAVETSIYVRRDSRGNGVGRRLYEALEKALALQNVCSINACIAYREQEDGYCSHDSVRFHEAMGYRLSGRISECGYKFGRWYDTLWMEKHLTPQPERPEALIPFPQVEPAFFASL